MCNIVELTYFLLPILIGATALLFLTLRKKKAREEKAKQAEINGVKLGRTKAEKLRVLAEHQRAARLLDGKLLDPSSDPPPSSRVTRKRSPPSQRTISVTLTNRASSR